MLQSQAVDNMQKATGNYITADSRKFSAIQRRQHLHESAGLQPLPIQVPGSALRLPL